MEGFIGYIVTFGVLAVIGIGLPRWFEWRRSLINRLPQQAEDVGHV
jgi:hypothetical protein